MSSQPSIGFISLGCPQALVDSERILTRLRAEGYGIVPSDADAPEIDGQVFVDTRGVRVGDIVAMTVTAANEHDLFGVPA